MKRFSNLLFLFACLAAWAVLLSACAGPGFPIFETDPPPLPEVSGSFYRIDPESRFLSGILPGMPLQDLPITAPTGEVSGPREHLGTGDTLSYPGGSITVIAAGDLDGDAAISPVDMQLLKDLISGIGVTSQALASGDLNGDGQVGVTDLLILKSHLNGSAPIFPTAASPLTDTGLFLSPGAGMTWDWGGKAACFVSANTALVRIDSSGCVTAGSAPGSTYIYALDSQGQVLCVAAVTVLPEALTLSLPEVPTLYQLNSTIQLEPVFNQNVSPRVKWSSSDPGIASVDPNGSVTTHAFGTAIITAQLPTGEKADVGITVDCGLDSIAFAKELYKIKPGAQRQLALILTPEDVDEVFRWESSNPSLVQVDDQGNVTGLAYGTATGVYSGLTASCQVKVCDVKQVAFTFDDGPSTNTLNLLDYLKERGFRVTFFLLGNRLNNHKEVLRRQVDEGHEIGYHSYSHVSQPELSSEKILSDYHRANEILKEITGAEFTLWRAPYGSFNQRVLSCVPLPHIHWKVDTLDWYSQDSEEIYQAIVSNVADGAIILLHDLYPCSVRGVTRAMDVLYDGDYEFLTVTELLSRDGTPPEKGVNYFNG